jgi:hypothetical protein
LIRRQQDLRPLELPRWVLASTQKRPKVRLGAGVTDCDCGGVSIGSQSPLRRHELGVELCHLQRGTRLITGLSGSRMEDMPVPESAAASPSLRGAA